MDDAKKEIKKKELKAKIVEEGLRDMERVFSNYAVATREEGELVLTFCEIEPLYMNIENDYRNEETGELNVRAKAISSIRMPIRMVPKLMAVLKSVTDDMEAKS